MSPLGKRAWTILQLLGEVFLYALWRDVVWGLHSKSLCKWVPILFLYALWRDVVWDLVFKSEFEGRTAFVSIRLVA